MLAIVLALYFDCSSDFPLGCLSFFGHGSSEGAQAAAAPMALEHRSTPAGHSRLNAFAPAFEPWAARGQPGVQAAAEGLELRASSNSGQCSSLNASAPSFEPSLGNEVIPCSPFKSPSRWQPSESPWPAGIAGNKSLSRRILSTALADCTSIFGLSRIISYIFGTYYLRFWRGVSNKCTKYYYYYIL